MPQPLHPLTLAAFNNDELRARIFQEKYALRDNDGIVAETTPAQMWARVAREAASVEKPENRAYWEQQFLWLLSDWRFIPAGRILHALGNPNKVTSCNCYVIPAPQDSIQGIFHTAWQLAETYKRGGGCGVDISTLRPAGSVVHNAARTSTGAVSFMELFSFTTGLIGQEGRRGALMLTISDSHPDVLAFCRVKRNQDAVRYANISVRISDAFMRAVGADTDWLLHYENPEVGLEIKRVIKARELWDELIIGATNFAEPGCLFWDTITRFSVSDRYPGMEVVSCNPCAEEPLSQFDNCCLGSVNLAAFVTDAFTPLATIDAVGLQRATQAAVRFLDNILTWNEGRHPLPEQEIAALRGRRIGLGLMGLADMLCQMGVGYDTDEGIGWASRTAEHLKLWAYAASRDLAREKGPFPAFAPAQHFGSPFFESFPGPFLASAYATGMRNVTVLTIPPTGTISSLVGVTSGLEPIFALSYTRRSESLSRGEFTVNHPLVARYCQQHQVSPKRDLPHFFVTAHTIKAEKRIAMQSALQAHVDQALSSTINLPAKTPCERVAGIYRKAWESGAKGVTVYCQGSRDGILTPTPSTSTTCATGTCEI